MFFFCTYHRTFNGWWRYKWSTTKSVYSFVHVSSAISNEMNWNRRRVSEIRSKWQQHLAIVISQNPTVITGQIHMHTSHAPHSHTSISPSTKTKQFTQIPFAADLSRFIIRFLSISLFLSLLSFYFYCCWIECTLIGQISFVDIKLYNIQNVRSLVRSFNERWNAKVKNSVSIIIMFASFFKFFWNNMMKTKSWKRMKEKNNHKHVCSFFAPKIKNAEKKNEEVNLVPIKVIGLMFDGHGAHLWRLSYFRIDVSFIWTIN